MNLYQKMYSVLFNGMTDALTALDAQNYGIGRDLLRKAQQDAEELYMAHGDVSPSGE